MCRFFGYACRSFSGKLYYEPISLSAHSTGYDDGTFVGDFDIIHERKPDQEA